MKTTMRKKGKFADGTTKYLLERDGETRTVMRPDKLWDLHSPDKNGDKPSRSDGETKEKASEKFSQELLSEPSDEEVARTLREIGGGK